uniref:AMP-binding domain-containing protein n=1 Tax=Heligmosomoides polygyrus TaxID=6339 RepID=A0A8L8KTD0_HELPZ
LAFEDEISSLKVLEAVWISNRNPSYGMTECGVVSHLPSLDSRDYNFITVGKLYTWTEDSLAEQRRGSPSWEPGEIRVRGTTVMRGYLNGPKATAETIDSDGWLHTTKSEKASTHKLTLRLAKLNRFHADISYRLISISRVSADRRDC